MKLCGGEILSLRGRRDGNHLHRAGRDRPVVLDDRAFPRVIWLRAGEHARTHRRHLRQRVLRDDGRHDIAAQGRAGLEQYRRLARVVADVELRAVGGQAGGGRVGHSRGKFATQRRGAKEHDLRFVLLDKVPHDGAERNGVVRRQFRIVGEIDSVGAEGDGALRQPLARRCRSAPRRPFRPECRPVRGPCPGVPVPPARASRYATRRTPKSRPYATARREAGSPPWRRATRSRRREVFPRLPAGGHRPVSRTGTPSGPAWARTA